jgi:hypothetical protein
MKKMKLFLPALIFMVFTACSDKKNQETIDFILSQPRDADLTGWWKWNTDSVFWYFKKTGTISEIVYQNGTVYRNPEDWYYWYTEKNDRKILHYFHPYGGPYASEYNHVYYKIENDFLWRSDGIEGDIQPTELHLFAVKTTAPKEYENW